MKNFFFALTFNQKTAANLLNQAKKKPTTNHAWHDQSKLHLTLAYCHHINQAEIKNITNKIPEITHSFTGDLLANALANNDFFGQNKKAFNIQQTAELLKLHNDLNQLLLSFGAKLALQKFTPHITVAVIEKKSSTINNSCLIKLKAEKIKLLQSKQNNYHQIWQHCL